MRREMGWRSTVRTVYPCERGGEASAVHDGCSSYASNSASLWGMLCVVVIPLLFVAISWEVVLGQSGKHRRQWRGQIDCI